MGKTVYNKLIRDRIPEIMQADGKYYELVVMTEEEYFQSLRSKLVEEALEAQKATIDELVTEIADIQEVIEAILKASHISPKQVELVQTQRHADRGGFEKRLKLLWTKDGDN
jgi:predicted house-cleaning noncanonical NTP pyrophosphatase (MazG superfamily)